MVKYIFLYFKFLEIQKEEKYERQDNNIWKQIKQRTSNCTKISYGRFNKILVYTRSKLNFLDVEIEKQYKLLNKKSNNITMNERTRIDLFYNADNTAIEFKFNRATAYSQNCTATKAGSLFRDFNRLSLLSYKDKYVIYVLDHNMLNYYKKAKAY